MRLVAQLVDGATLLKAGRSGKPHYRRFRLSKDLCRLSWESANKDVSESSVLISQITEMKLGQTTPIFKRCPVSGYESLSFSLLYGDRTLDIVCKEKREYEVWTTALGILLSKKDRDNYQALQKSLESFQEKKRSTASYDKLSISVGTIKTTVQVLDVACDLYTWGSGVRGILGHKDEDNEKLPRVVDSLLGRNITMVTCGVAHTMALSAQGEVFSWGSGKYGRLGHGHMRDRFSPLMIGAPLRGLQVIQIACHENHSAALTDVGQLFTWGRAGPYLGYEVVDNKQMRPRPVDALAQIRVVAVSCGRTHTLACTDTERVYSFGENRFGELGLGDCEPKTVPTEIPSLTGALKIACGGHHSACIDRSYTLLMWGWGERGQLGQGNQESLYAPAPVKSFPKEIQVTEISCGDAHNCALMSNGTAYSWGDNTATQLGIQMSSYTDVNKPKPVMVPQGNLVLQVACGANFTAIMTKSLNGTRKVFTWGLGTSGQLGHGDGKGRAIPTQIEALTANRVCSVACGGEHMACTVVQGWVPDEEVNDCMACKKPFTQIRRRHHCRRCGGVFCGSCTAKKLAILDKGFSTAVRVCDRCYTEQTKNT